jgi:dTMP kinase
MTAPLTGTHVAVSGCDGAGKSRLVAALADAFRIEGRTVRTLSALKPRTASPMEWLRELTQLSAPPPPVVESWIGGFFTLVLLHNDASTVASALAAGEWVVSDRWSLDHEANQYALGVDLEHWTPLLRTARKPDVHLLLDVPVAVAQQRIAARGGSGIGTGAEFLAECSERMRTLADDPAHAPVVVLDASRPAAQVLADALAAVRRATDPRVRSVR